jgi:hypothetical protein
MKPSDQGRKGTPSSEQAQKNQLSRWHLKMGWWLILIFLTLGIGLESLHGFKVPWYLDLSNSTRRLMFTLAHSHGTLFGLLNVAFGLTLPHLPDWKFNRARLAGRLLFLASLLIPGGFLLGGLVIYGGDPGLGILLVPVGAVCLLVGVLMIAQAFKPGGR